MKQLVIFSRKKIITLLVICIVLIIIGSNIFKIMDYYTRARFGVEREVYLQDIPVGRKLQHEVEDEVKSLNRERFARPRNAFFHLSSGEVVEEKYGEKIDVDATVERIFSAEQGEAVEPAVVPLDPEITQEVFKNIDTPTGSYATGFGGGNRGNNIIIAAGLLNNNIVAPGETFSFNKATGPRIPEKGYKPAPVIVGGTVIQGYGGGVCQVSSTLYNAVLEAGLKVVERYPHSRPIDYVPRGRDATVSDFLDFKFRNNTDNFIMIKSWGGGGRLVVEIWE